MHVLYCKQAGVKTVKIVSAETCKFIAKLIHMSLRPRVGLTLWVTAELHTECVSARCYCWQTGHSGGAGGGCGHAILSPDSGQTWHRPLMGVRLERQLVCMSMFMEYAFILAHKSWARSPASISRVSSYTGGQCGFSPLFFFDHVQSVKDIWKCTSSMAHFWKQLTFTCEIQKKFNFIKDNLKSEIPSAQKEISETMKWLVKMMRMSYIYL